MITRTSLKRGGNLALLDAPVPQASVDLQAEGFAAVRDALTEPEQDELRAELNEIFETTAPDIRLPGSSAEDYQDFRYEMLNRSPAAQRTVAHPKILEVIEPLLGEDCHVVSNTAWRNAPEREKAPFDVGNPWHTDAGPHVPRPAGVPWDERIPYPVFMIGCHILLRDCLAPSGPTGFVPRSHTSGQGVPEPDASGNIYYEGRGPITVEGRAGDIVFFVSDIWHRRMPTGPEDEGRLFLQVQYGRRDIAQRLRTTDIVNHLSPEAIARALTDRERTVVGLHPPGFYDA
jgi:ectoine hydroxylase-related dioxygenase (phytanoyl-CoA dioxygenase family)